MTEVKAGEAFAVYGLLRAGESGFAQFGLEHAFAPLGPCVLPGQLYDLGAYPGLVDAPGEVIGEMSLMDRKGASANIVADGPAEILSVPKAVLHEKLESDIHFTARFYESLFLDVTRKLRSTNQRVMPVPP